MGERLTERDRVELPKLFARTGGKAWEPKDCTHPFFDRAIADGYLRRVDGRCGFELLKDAMVDWTPAARAALREQKDASQEARDDG